MVRWEKEEATTQHTTCSLLPFFSFFLHTWGMEDGRSGTFYTNTQALTSATKAHDDVIPCLLLTLLCDVWRGNARQGMMDDDGTSQCVLLDVAVCLVCCLPLPC
jgi:hypothetical protein